MQGVFMSKKEQSMLCSCRKGCKKSIVLKEKMYVCFVDYEKRKKKKKELGQSTKESVAVNNVDKSYTKSVH